jgi:hypothetical protein
LREEKMTKESLMMLEDALDSEIGEGWHVLLNELDDGGVEALVMLGEPGERSVNISGTDLEGCRRAVQAAKHQVLEQLMSLLTGGPMQ